MIKTGKIYFSNQTHIGEKIMKFKKIIINALIISQLISSTKPEVAKKPLGSRFVKNKEELFFKSDVKFSNESIQTDPEILLRAAKCSLRYFISTNKKDTDLVKSKILEKRIFPHAQAKKTLRFIIKTIEEDKGKPKSKQRIMNTNFLNKNFQFIKWYGDKYQAKINGIVIPKWPDGGELKNGKIKLTSYATFISKGNYFKTKEFPHALFSMVSPNFDKSIRFWHSKQDIFSGVLEQNKYKKHVKPLVWLSKNDVEEALMQGNIVTRMPNGDEKTFIVHKSNGVPYNKKVKKFCEQKKYWYFKKLSADEKYPKMTDLGKAAFAGDVENIGLGKIIAIRYKNPINNKREIRLGVLIDRGSAFSNNLYQLDLFAGKFDNREQFRNFIKYLPNTVEAYLLKKR